MKRVFILLFALLLAVIPAIAEEVFTLHSGTQFGMSATEVLTLEAQKGFILKFDSRERNGELYQGMGRIANQDNVEIGYLFMDDQMYQMYYKFPISAASYTAIETSLVTKYGETKYTSLTGFTMPKTRHPIGLGHPNMPTSNVEYMPDFSQRLIVMENGQYILIDHYMNKYSHTLIYFVLTEEQARILTSAPAYSDDL